MHTVGARILNKVQLWMVEWRLNEEWLFSKNIYNRTIPNHSKTDQIGDHFGSFVLVWFQTV